MRRGFTLLELMVVVVIVGLLASAAIPQYGKLVDRIREAEAVNVISAGCTGQFFYYFEHGKFTPNTSELMVTLPGALGGWVLPGTSPNYQWTTTTTTAQIIATSAGHNHPSAAEHQVRGTVDANGTTVMEVKRPGNSNFIRL